jgi:hypothetical protein
LKNAFIRQRLEDEKPSTPENSVCKSAAKLFHHRLAPAFNILPFHDHPPDVPVQADQFLVDCLEGLVLGGTNALFDLGQQARVSARFCHALLPSAGRRFIHVPPYQLPINKRSQQKIE